ncbi:ABC transporter ATP-binding protein [Chitinophaga vietnamensis]|uniref:ABC transporter ATP-binding protein n=1 Tax=Chitinophaga vietnamensis TaxID=2593957 RepID=UPI0011778B64|nr:ABC transporter ATP-binding protein [Chitinophaga vietnamensis]
MKWKDYQVFFSYLYPFWVRELLLFVLMIAGTLAGLASPYALKLIIDQYIPGKDYAGLLAVLGVLIIIYLLRMLIGFWSDYISTWIANKVVHNIKQNLFSNLMRQPYAYFEENNPGDIIQKVNQEVHKIQYFLTNSILRLSYNIFSIAGLSSMLLLLDYKLFLVALSVFPFSIILNRLWNRKIKVLVEKISVAEGGIFNFYIDRIRNMKVIRTYNAAGKESSALEEKLDQLFSLYRRSGIYSSLSRNASSFFLMAGPLIMLAYGGYRVMLGALTTGTLVAFIQYMNRLYAPSNDIVFFYVDYVNAKVSMKRILPLLGKFGKLPSGRDSVSEQAIASLRLNKICFRYNQTEIISALSFEFVSGKSYALVGLNGSGKSTLLKVIGRLYDPQEGDIIVNDTQSLAEIPAAEWYEHVNIIHQEPLLFMETIRFNLDYGGRGATDHEMWEALEAVGLRSFVEQLPAGLDTVLGDGKTGIILSGGQQQQVVIARALLRGGQVLILDEATSAIDSYKEQLILQNIIDRYRSKIVIAISHRLSTVRDLDEIIVLHQGRIVENGTHHHLVAKEGQYCAIFESQMKAAEQVSI